MDAVQRIALAIMRGHGANPLLLNPPLAAAPPPVNPMDFGVPQQDVTPAPAALPQAPPQAQAASTAAPAVPAPAPIVQATLPEMPPSLAIPATQAAPGMSRIPQTDQQLADWRAMMDRLQFARQGA